MKILKQIVHILSLISYIGIGVYAIACIPNFLGYRPLIVMTGSMEPMYKVGSIIYYEKVKEDEIKVNDVITFKNNGALITHRVVKVDDNGYTTKGDANDSEDPNKVKYEDIAGRVKKISIPYLGYYVQFINGHIYMIYGVVLILVLEFLFSNINFNTKKNRDESID